MWFRFRDSSKEAGLGSGTGNSHLPKVGGCHRADNAFIFRSSRVQRLLLYILIKGGRMEISQYTCSIAPGRKVCQGLAVAMDFASTAANHAVGDRSTLLFRSLLRPWVGSERGWFVATVKYYFIQTADLCCHLKSPGWMASLIS